MVFFESSIILGKFFIFSFTKNIVKIKKLPVKIALDIYGLVSIK
jgi:hypothetical protein